MYEMKYKIEIQKFGGRGARLGKYFRHGKEMNYGDEYYSVLEVDNIKFIKPKERAVTAPMETRTKDRVYVTLDENNEVKHISFYDENGKRTKQIDIDHHTHTIDGKKRVEAYPLWLRTC